MGARVQAENSAQGRGKKDQRGNDTWQNCNPTGLRPDVKKCAKKKDFAVVDMRLVSTTGIRQLRAGPSPTSPALKWGSSLCSSLFGAEAQLWGPTNMFRCSHLSVLKTKPMLACSCRPSHCRPSHCKTISDKERNSVGFFTGAWAHTS